MVETLVKSAGM
jgi:hypothetical protein